MKRKWERKVFPRADIRLFILYTCQIGNRGLCYLAGHNRSRNSRSVFSPIKVVEWWWDASTAGELMTMHPLCLSFQQMRLISPCLLISKHIVLLAFKLSDPLDEYCL